jgi:hypothetical protein
VSEKTAPQEELEARFGHLIPDDFRALGWSGTFMLEATLSEPDKADEMESRLPDRVPFGTNSGWLAVCLNREVTPPTVVLVRRDENAIVDLVQGPRL